MELSVEVPYSAMTDGRQLDELARQGVTVISAPFDFVQSAPKETLRGCAAALKAGGIRVDTSHPLFGGYNKHSLVDQYTAQRLRYIEIVKDYLDRMSLLGARVAPLHTGGCCLPGAPEWTRALCLESLAALLPAARDAGVLLALENTFFASPPRWDGGTDAPPEDSTRYVYDDMDLLCGLIDAAGSPWVKGCFDAGHAHYLGDLTGDHAAMGGRIALYHIHDNSRDKDMHLPPGYGTLDWEALGPLVRETKAAHPPYIEAQPWAKGTYRLMMRQTNALLSGGRRGESRRCLACGHLRLWDEAGEFCGCGDS